MIWLLYIIAISYDKLNWIFNLIVVIAIYIEIYFAKHSKPESSWDYVQYLNLSYIEI